MEILGVLKDSLGPGRDMILARLGGLKPEYTGVVAGMSGSPVYIDGRLVGALSYRIGQFSKEPIAGITPIEQMLEVRDGVAVPGGGCEGEGPERTRCRRWRRRWCLGGSARRRWSGLGTGFAQWEWCRWRGWGGVDRSVGAAGAAGAGERGECGAGGGRPVDDGDVHGDVCRPKRLLACGHPITQSGAVDMPMTKAEVLATLPSPLNAFKIVNATEEVGAFREDRASAILGRFGAVARMIPVTVEVRAGDAGEARSYHLRVLRQP